MRVLIPESALVDKILLLLKAVFFTMAELPAVAGCGALKALVSLLNAKMPRRSLFYVH